MSCIKCGNAQVIKNGSVHGRAKKKCTVCGYQFSKDTVHDYQKYPLRIKMLAVWLYISGVSMRRISRLCQCSTQSVLNWVRKYAREHYEKPSLESKCVMLEVDEMWHDLQKKPLNPGSGKLWIVIQDSCLTGNVGVVIEQPSKSSPID